MRQMAKKWNMVENKTDLLDIIGSDQKVSYYLMSDHDIKNQMILQEGYSFKQSRLMEGTYSNYLTVLE